MADEIMYKRIGLMQRKKTLSCEAFETHWLTRHAELCKKLPNMRWYSVNLVEPGRMQQVLYGTDEPVAPALQLHAPAVPAAGGDGAAAVGATPDRVAALSRYRTWAPA